MSKRTSSSVWTKTRYEEESKSASDLLEAMYKGTFTVEMSTEDENFVTPYIRDSSESQPLNKRRLNLDKIAQPIDESNDHLREIFGGKLPFFLEQGFDSSSTATNAVAPKKTPKQRSKRLPTLEKLDKITRPPNSFMIFAQEYRPKLSEEYPRCKNKDISVKLGLLWRAMPTAVRNMYNERALEIADEHKRKNPWYVYNPQEARVRKAQRDQTKLAQRAARQRKNSGHVDQEGSPPPHMMRHPCLPRNGPGLMPPFGAHPHKVFHGSAAAAVSANEMRGLGGPAVQHAYGASPPPQRFYPAPPYVDHNSYSMQQQYSSSQHHQLPAAWFGQQHQYHTQQHHQQMQPNGGYINRSLGREVPYMNSHYMPSLPAPHTPQQHQLLGPNNEPEEDLTPIPSHVMTSQYEVEGTAPPSVAPDTTPAQQIKESDENKPSPIDNENPDSQPLPPFQHAFGSTEIGRFAHEGFSAQDPELIEIEVVEIEGEFEMEGQRYVIECTVPDPNETENSQDMDRSMESVILLSL